MFETDDTTIYKKDALNTVTFIIGKLVKNLILDTL